MARSRVLARQGLPAAKAPGDLPPMDDKRMNAPENPLGAAFWRVLPTDGDPVETREWLDAFDTLVTTLGPDRGTYVLRRLLDAARARQVPLPPVHAPHDP